MNAAADAKGVTNRMRSGSLSGTSKFENALCATNMLVTATLCLIRRPARPNMLPVGQA